MSNKKAIEDMFTRSSQEFKDKWYEIMWGKDGKSGVMREPYADKLADLLPEGIKLLKMLDKTQKEGIPDLTHTKKKKLTTPTDKI